MIGRMLVPHKTRRWPRVPVDLPVKVVTAKGFSTTVVPGRGTELSEGGMVLYAGILLSPGDLLEVEFDIPRAATTKGELDLSWYREAGLGGNGRGCEVAEVWLIKK